MSNGTRVEDAKHRAEALFRKRPDAPGAAPGAAADASSAEAEKIAKLRALRLAKERSDEIAADVRRTRRLMKRP